MAYWSSFSPYVSVAEKKARAAREAKKLQKGGSKLRPIVLPARSIATTFWGKAWCTNMESYSDYANRIPRGRSYVRSGAVIDLKIAEGKVAALVSGSSLYKVAITIKPLPADRWNSIKDEAQGRIESLIELIQGRFSKGVMETMTRQKLGLFPHPSEIKLSCSCPDWADMCKHVAAVMYGVGARLDESPELLFTLRQVDHLELLKATEKMGGIAITDSTLGDESLSELFDIEIANAVTPTAAAQYSIKGQSHQRSQKPLPKATTKPKRKIVAKRAIGAKKTGKAKAVKVAKAKKVKKKPRAAISAKRSPLKKRRKQA